MTWINTAENRMINLNLIKEIKTYELYVEGEAIGIQLNAVFPDGESIVLGVILKDGDLMDFDNYLKQRNEIAGKIIRKIKSEEIEIDIF